MRSATTGFFSTFASTKSLMRHRSSQRLKNVAASLYGSGPCDTVKAVVAPVNPRIPVTGGRKDLSLPCPEAGRLLVRRGRAAPHLRGVGRPVQEPRDPLLNPAGDRPRLEEQLFGGVDDFDLRPLVVHRPTVFCPWEPSRHRRRSHR